MRNHLRRLAFGCLLGIAAVGMARCARESPTSPAVTSMMFAESDYIVKLGASRQVELFAYDDQANPLALPAGIVWRSSDPSRVTVDSTGQARGVGLGGPVTITAAVAGRTVSTRVTVLPAFVTIAPAPDSLKLGQSVQLIATARDASGVAVAAGATTWLLTPAGFATISPSGLVTASAWGAFTVSATIDGVTAQLATGVSSPYDGWWTGAGTDAYGQAQPVSFSVRFGSIAQFSIPNIRTSCGPQTAAQFNLVLDVPIVSDQFRHTVNFFGGGVQTIGGTFTSPTTLTGSYSGVRLAFVSCPDGGLASPTVVTSAFAAGKL